ncbi:MAG TPA: M15 family metallopeptidase [Acidimicrobiia bacterium]|nr:M15 family metallopeptidase [Acidimicrobiia bacterium]
MPKLRSSVALSISVALFAVTGGAAAADVSPINPNNRPTGLSGVENGVVPTSRLVNVAPNCIAAREAGPSLARIFAMAREINDALGADQCYRPLSQQVDFANQANQPGNNPACVASVGATPTGKPVGRSYHGWGKAADLTDAGQSLTFASPGYAFMKRVAGSLGWNHPAFAEPGGSTCPEPWHWEWVGDGGNLGSSPRRGDAIALLPSANDAGYAVVDGLGGISPHGNFLNRGSASSIPVAWVMVGAANTRDRGGYWMVGADGGVFSYGNAHFYGSTGGLRLAQPVNAITPTRSGKGYWLLAWDGGVFSFGDARFFGSTGALHLNFPVDGMASTPSGNGYWLVASDGGVFSFGDAHFYGSTGAIHLNSPIVGMAPTATGKGYWMVASDGGVFTFGDAKFAGSLAPFHTPSPTIGIVPTRSGHGYWLELADGQVFGFGDAHAL